MKKSLRIKFKTNVPFSITLFMVTLVCLTGYKATAQWSSNPAVNNAICTATSNQHYPTIVSDGSGGAIITWEDLKSGSWDIYAQRINASGIVQWTTDGVVICNASYNQYAPTLVSDGSGGAIITWYDNRSGTNADIYAQRINASGTVQWTANGVAACTASNNQLIPNLVSDGSGGAVITWQDSRSGNYDIYAQRINASGAVQWTADGVAICTASISQLYPTIIMDGSGGGVITWQDNRSGNSDIYAQRINASGAVQWTTDGVAICTATSNQQFPLIVSDGSGGGIITWQDFRSGSHWDIYAQRINASGTVQWSADGVAISTATSSQEGPTVASDGSGGAIIAWMDYRSGYNFDIYAQRVNASGSVQWTADGEVISAESSHQISPTIISDGSGGAIVTWYDYRSGGNYDIYAQRINASGTVQWTADGVAISTATNVQQSPTIVSDGSGGAIITWEDHRSGSNWDIYAQNIIANGTVGGLICSTITSITSTPTSEVTTGGVSTNLYIGYPTNTPGTTLVAVGGNSNVTWSPTTYLSCSTCSSTIFSPTAAGSYTITATCGTSSQTVTICVKDIRVPNTSGSKAAVYMCHKEPVANTTKTLAVLLRGIPGHFQYHSGDKLGVCGNTCATSKRDFDFENLVIDEQSLEVMCSPNPFRQSFKLHYISNSEAEAIVAIYGMTGNLVETITLAGVADEAELGSNLPNGIYTVSFIQGDKNRVFRMIKVD